MKNINYKFKIISLIIIGSWLLTQGTPHAHADGISLSVSPPLLSISLKPSSDYTAPITLINQGIDPVNVEIILKPFLPFDEDGRILYPQENLITGDYKQIFKYLNLTDQGIITNHFNLAPKQKKTIELQLQIPDNEKVSDYYFSIIFLASPSLQQTGQGGNINQNTPQSGSPESISEDNPEYHNYSLLHAGIASNILLSIIPNDKVRPENSISPISIVEFSSPVFIQSGPVSFSLRIRNNEKNLVAPSGDIFIKNMFGQTIGKVDIAPANILAGSIRRLTDTNYASRSSTATQESITKSNHLTAPKIHWEEKFLLGLYTASLSLNIPDQTKPLTATIVFFALPAYLIIAGAVILILIIIFTIRVRHHLKTDA